MIINYPTGLYLTILPAPLTAGNITYTISDNPPPIYADTFLQLPPDEELLPSPTPIYNKQQRRAFLGNLVFDVTIPGNSTSGSGSKQYEIGEIIDFTTAPVSTSDPYELPSIELRQDTAVVNYTRYGLDTDDVATLTSQAELQIDALTAQISQVGTFINQNTDLMSLNQADVNQSTKLYNNIVAVLGAGSSQAAKVLSQVNNYTAQTQQLINARAALEAQLDDLRTQLDTIREVVR